MLAFENQFLATCRRDVENNLGAGSSDEKEILLDVRAMRIRKKARKCRTVTAVSLTIAVVLALICCILFHTLDSWYAYYGEDSKEDFYDKLNTTEVQIKEVGRKLEGWISSVRKDFDEKMEMKGHEIDMKLKGLNVRCDALEKYVDGFETKGFLTKEEFGEVFEEFKTANKTRGEVSLHDEIRDCVRQIVVKEIETHTADWAGMVDYASASGGSKVLTHSEPYRPGAKAEKMILPGFGEPGKCFPLEGDSGFVEIRLRAAIVPVALTLEHVAKNVAYDRFDAPKHCRVYGWMQGQVSTDDMEIDMSKFLLNEFTYDLEKSNAQTFMVEAAAYCLVDTIGLDFTSNHGNASHTCIYRLRVHGREPV